MKRDAAVEEVVRKGANPGLNAAMVNVLRVDLHLQLMMDLYRMSPLPRFFPEGNWS